MNNTAVMQVRVKPKIKQKAQKKAESLGYSSVQEVVRIFLNSFIAGQIRPGIVAVEEGAEQFPPEEITLGPKGKKASSITWQYSFDLSRNRLRNSGISRYWHPLAGLRGVRSKRKKAGQDKNVLPFRAVFSRNVSLRRALQGPKAASTSLFTRLWRAMPPRQVFDD